MDFTYKNRKHIARITFVPIVFLLLLALNYKIWGGIYKEGDLQELIISQSQELEHCLLSNNDTTENVKAIIEIKQLLYIGFISTATGYFLLSFTPYIWIYQSKLFCKRRYTLVSLCVRMDE